MNDVTRNERLPDGEPAPLSIAPLWASTWLRRDQETFVGRNEYLADIERKVQSGARLLLLHGPGGNGKTRLARQAAEQLTTFCGGRVFGVSFVGPTAHNPDSVRPEQVARAMADALSMPPAQVGAADAAALATYLNRRYPGQPLLLILDGFERATNAATRALLSNLLAEAPQLRLLVTCRTPFALEPYGHALEVGGLRCPPDADARLEEYEGYRLFLDRAPAGAPPSDTSDRAAIVAILAAVEGSPLGIELALARAGISGLSLSRVAAELQESHRQWQRTEVSRPHVDERSGGVERHLSLEVCLDWTYRLLPVAEQALYRRLTLFPAAFAPSAAQEIADITPDQLAHWCRLRLLQTIDERFIVAPTLREFAAGRLLAGEVGDLTARFIACFFALVQRNQDIALPEQVEALRADLGNLYAAAWLLCGAAATAADGVKLVWFGLMLANAPVGARSENLRLAIQCYQAALRVRTEQDFPRDWATTQNNLGLACFDLPDGDRGQNLQSAIRCYESALNIYAEQDYPLEWAATQYNLGNAWAAFHGADRGESVQKAIRCFEAALRVYTEQDYPLEWAETRSALGHAWADLPDGEKGTNLRQAIRCHESALNVYTEADFPLEWATAQSDLGNSYFDLPDGDRSENLRRVIQCYEAALRVRTERECPEEWATTQNNLGAAHFNLSTGDRNAHLLAAIERFKAALKVRTEQDFPLDWAVTQSNLGIAYYELPGNDRDRNLERAIQCFEAALRVYTEAKFPKDWARMQTNLGNAHRNLSGGDCGQNMRRAIKCYEAALKVRTEREMPREWALLRTNLGLAYANIPGSDRGYNLQKAIQCFESAQRVYTRNEFPKDWAGTQNNLGMAYSHLPPGPQGQNLLRAIRCFEATLQVYTEADFPREWAGVQNNLGNIYSNLPGTDRKENLRRAMQCYEAALRVLTEQSYPEYRRLVLSNLDTVQSRMAGPPKEPPKPGWRLWRR